MGPDLCILGEAVGIAAWAVEYESTYAVYIFDGDDTDNENVKVSARRIVVEPGSDILTSLFTAAELKVSSHTPPVSHLYFCLLLPNFNI